MPNDTSALPLNQYEAAGGVVMYQTKFLVLRKITKNEWVLPKGHVEPGETIEAAAVREVQEETGYQNLRVLHNLGTVSVAFTRPNKSQRVLRNETYFLMELLDETPAPRQDYDDAEHDQTAFEAHWLTAAEAATRMTFDSGRTFMHRASEWLSIHHA